MTQKYWVGASYGHKAVFDDLNKAKIYAYLVCAEAPDSAGDGTCCVAKDYPATMYSETLLYTVKRDKLNITSITKGVKKKLSLVVPDKYRGMFLDVWPYAYHYADAKKKSAKMEGTQYRALAIYYVAKDIRDGKYANGVIYKGARKLKYIEVNPVTKSSFEIKTKENGKYKTKIMSWSEISDPVKNL